MVLSFAILAFSGVHFGPKSTAARTVAKHEGIHTFGQPSGYVSSVVPAGLLAL